MITFKLNGREVQGNKGEYILQVAEKYGVEIPTLCHHKALEPVGMCRLCTVQVFDGIRTRFVTACNSLIMEGMEVSTDAEEVQEIRKLVVELLYARCPNVPFVKELAAKYGIKETSFKKEDDDCILCGLCARICERMGNSAIGLTGRGLDLKVDTPFHIQTDVCIACGACVSVCPTGHITLEDITKHAIKAIPSEYDVGLKGRKPIYVPYAQAIPNTPAIDRSKCVHFKTGGCKICSEFCGVEAIDYSQEDETVELNVGAIVLAPGFQPFDPSRFETYNYARHPNVITSMELERILSASGPTMGHLVRLSDHTEPKKIAWLQCVGSRDINRCDQGYCSAVCCMYAIKEAIVAKEHSKEELDTAIFYMDMRTYGKDFEKYYMRAEEESGVRFIRSRIHSVDPVDNGNLLIKYATEAGEIKEEIFDLAVLSVGLSPNKDILELSDKLGVELNHHQYAQTGSFTPVSTNRDGIYLCGVFQGPKDIPQSVMEASAAAAASGQILARARGTMTRTKELPPEKDFSGEEARIGVFVCNCGINIGGVADVPSVREYAKGLPHVVHVEDSLFTCSQDTQDKMKEVIKDKGINRVVVASCSPRTHEPLFQDTIRDAGLNKYLFEMANIRNQNTWVHKDDPVKATEKAKDLVRMAVAKAAYAEPLQQVALEVTPSVLVIGGGVAGMEAAFGVAQQGYQVYLVEKTDKLGGVARRLRSTWKGEKIPPYLEQLIQQIHDHPLIQVFLETEVQDTAGIIGNFSTTLATAKGSPFLIEHGATIVATGGQEYRPREYLYGEHTGVLTHLELDEAITQGDPRIQEAGTAVFIQCVGSRIPERPYCSRTCCTHSLETALSLKKMKPEMDIYIIYRDLRSYGFREDLYREARQKGVTFIRYDLEDPPRLAVEEARNLSLVVTDHVLERPVQIPADLVILATAIIPNENKELFELFKVPVNNEGFLIEAHMKLRPVDFASDGLFMAGLAHYPKPLDESIAQAKAAVSRAMTILSRKSILVGGVVAAVNPDLCAACLTCVRTCPYNAPHIGEEGYAIIEPAECRGCGACVAECPGKAIKLQNFTDEQIIAKTDALFLAA